MTNKNKNLLLLAVGLCATGLGGLAYCKCKQDNINKPTLKLKIDDFEPKYISINVNDYKHITQIYKFIFDPIVSREVIKSRRMGKIYGCEIRIDSTIKNNFMKIEDSDIQLPLSKFTFAVSNLITKDSELK